MYLCRFHEVSFVKIDCLFPVVPQLVGYCKDRIVAIFYVRILTICYFLFFNENVVVNCVRCGAHISK